jgi:hypothetical protein
MNADCIYYDVCETRNLSSCCGADLICHDICSDCKDHSGDGCDDCQDYLTDEDWREKEAENNNAEERDNN